MSTPRSLAGKLPVLWLLYFTQGLPYGFQATALPILLREQGVSLVGIGFASLLSLPWMLKVLWSPLLDRWGSPRLGRRKSWILPLQALLVASALAGIAAAPSESADVTPILALVFCLNLFAATLDIAVDGLAIDLLEPHELGTGNIAQVVGFKIGMLTGGGFLVWLTGDFGWSGLFAAMAALLVVCLGFTAAWSEPRSLTRRDRPSLSTVLQILYRSLKQPRALLFLGFIVTYKLGETMADAMFKPFLVDNGFTRSQIGLWLGTWGMLFSIAGSIAGGWLASRSPRLVAVAITASLRALPVAGEWWLSVVGPEASAVLIVTCAENFFGGALTTAMFAYMMSRVDRRIGATHYTLLASLEVWGKLPAGWLGGWVAQTWSYSVTFGCATVLSVAYLAWIPFLAGFRSPEDCPPENEAGPRNGEEANSVAASDSPSVRSSIKTLPQRPPREIS